MQPYFLRRCLSGLLDVDGPGRRFSNFAAAGRLIRPREALRALSAPTQLEQGIGGSPFLRGDAFEQLRLELKVGRRCQRVAVAVRRAHGEAETALEASIRS